MLLHPPKIGVRVASRKDELLGQYFFKVHLMRKDTKDFV